MVRYKGKDRIEFGYLKYTEAQYGTSPGATPSTLFKMGFIDEDTLGEALAELSSVPYAFPGMFEELPPNLLGLLPTKLEMTAEDHLRIHWNDDQVREYSPRELREACPCATCREKRKQAPPASMELPVLSAAEAAPLKVLGMKPVGNYAYSIAFSDGHDTGIYTLESLRELGREVAV